MTEKAAAPDFPDNTSALDTLHSGFYPNHGMETTLIALTDDFCRQLDQGRLALLFLSDISTQHGLLQTVNHHFAVIGICETALQLLVSFLDGETEDGAGRVCIHEDPLIYGCFKGLLSPHCY